MNYYCMICKMVHDQKVSGGVIFQTGFRRLDGKDISVGICQEKHNADSTPERT